MVSPYLVTYRSNTCSIIVDGQVGRPVSNPGVRTPQAPGVRYVGVEFSLSLSQGVTVIPGPGQQLMQAAMPSGMRTCVMRPSAACPGCEVGGALINVSGPRCHSAIR